MEACSASSASRGRIHPDSRSFTCWTAAIRTRSFSARSNRGACRNTSCNRRRRVRAQPADKGEHHEARIHEARACAVHRCRPAVEPHVGTERRAHDEFRFRESSDAAGRRLLRRSWRRGDQFAWRHFRLHADRPPDDVAGRLLFVANADNNSIGVIGIADPKHSEVLGFIPSGWYPSALTLVNGGEMLYVGNSKGQASYPDIKGPGSPLASQWYGDETIKTMQKGSVEMIPLSDLRQKLAGYTKQVMANTPYEDSQLTLARAPKAPSVIPREVGAGSPIEHIIYIIKENRTYDQVFGDIAKGNGDSRLTIFGRNVTPNQHALVERYVLLDNLYCDGEVSVDGHSWSNSAYATDFNEKLWPQDYGRHSKAEETAAYIPSAGHLWDLARRKGLTYRSYGEYARRASDGKTMEAAKGVDGLWGHVSPHFFFNDTATTENVDVFLKEFAEYEKHFDDMDPAQRLPNFMVMSLGEDHTRGTQPGAFTPVAMVANNDQAIGRLVDRVSHSKYWAKTAIFIIEDDAQDGPDHVDARRTVGLVISPYIRRGMVDSTLYTTSSFLRSMELLLGLPPMSRYDAAAMPLYASFDVTANPTPFDVLPAEVDLNAKNTVKSAGAKASARIDFDDYDRAPMQALNEIIWKSVRGADSPMPSPVHRYRPIIDVR